jgi:hypothetical protein
MEKAIDTMTVGFISPNSDRFPVAAWVLGSVLPGGEGWAFYEAIDLATRHPARAKRAAAGSLVASDLAQMVPTTGISDGAKDFAARVSYTAFCVAVALRLAKANWEQSRKEAESVPEKLPPESLTARLPLLSTSTKMWLWNGGLRGVAQWAQGQGERTLFAWRFGRALGEVKHALDWNDPALRERVKPLTLFYAWGTHQIMHELGDEQLLQRVIDHFRADPNYATHGAAVAKAMEEPKT